MSEAIPLTPTPEDRTNLRANTRKARLASYRSNSQKISRSTLPQKKPPEKKETKDKAEHGGIDKIFADLKNETWVIDGSGKAKDLDTVKEKEDVVMSRSGGDKMSKEEDAENMTFSEKMKMFDKKPYEVGVASLAVNLDSDQNKKFDKKPYEEVEVASLAVNLDSDQNGEEEPMRLSETSDRLEPAKEEDILYPVNKSAEPAKEEDIFYSVNKSAEPAKEEDIFRPVQKSTEPAKEEDIFHLVQKSPEPFKDELIFYSSKRSPKDENFYKKLGAPKKEDVFYSCTGDLVVLEDSAGLEDSNAVADVHEEKEVIEEKMVADVREEKAVAGNIGEKMFDIDEDASAFQPSCDDVHDDMQVGTRDAEEEKMLGIDDEEKAGASAFQPSSDDAQDSTRDAVKESNDTKESTIISDNRQASVLTVESAVKDDKIPEKKDIHDRKETLPKKSKLPPNDNRQVSEPWVPTMESAVKDQPKPRPKDLKKTKEETRDFTMEPVVREDNPKPPPIDFEQQFKFISDNRQVTEARVPIIESAVKDVPKPPSKDFKNTETKKEPQKNEENTFKKSKRNSDQASDIWQSCTSSSSFSDASQDCWNAFDSFSSSDDEEPLHSPATARQRIFGEAADAASLHLVKLFSSDKTRIPLKDRYFAASLPPSAHESCVTSSLSQILMQKFSSRGMQCSELTVTEPDSYDAASLIIPDFDDNWEQNAKRTQMSVVPGGFVILILLSDATDEAAVSKYGFFPEGWGEATLLFEEKDDLLVFCIPKRSCLVNLSAGKWKDTFGNKERNLQREFEILEQVTIVPSAKVYREAEADTASPSTESHHRLSLPDIQKASHALAEHGFCILRHSFSRSHVCVWGDAAISDLISAIEILKKDHNIDLQNPSQHKVLMMNFRELAMREDYRVDLRSGKNLERLRSSVREDWIRKREDLQEILREVMNPRDEENKYHMGNYGRWNFEQMGPESPADPPTSNKIGFVITMPKCADQAIHADTPHLFEHVDNLPPHYINLFLPASRVPLPHADGSSPVGGTAFIAGSHRLSTSQKFTASDMTPSVKKEMYMEIVRPSLIAGDAVLFDCRILHFGLGNGSSSSFRPMLYVNWMQRWFQDPKNWNEENVLFKDNS